LCFPVIVKPTDRSGSRGINKVDKIEDLRHAIECSISESFEKKALVEEFADGDEYSDNITFHNSKMFRFNDSMFRFPTQNYSQYLKLPNFFVIHGDFNSL
jgi:phosphoribosylamine-glycine ligase